MDKINTYDVLIIGGGISGCVFASNYLKDNPRNKVALVEIGRGLGGRSSTRISQRFDGWELNHGSPNLNICNSENSKLLKNYIKELLENKFIKIDDSEIVQLENDLNLGNTKHCDFSVGRNYLSLFSMSQLSQNILDTIGMGSQIDLYFKTFIVDLKFNNNHWKFISLNGDKFYSKYLVCSSNLLLHKRSLAILNTNKIPLRAAIPQNKDQIIDSLINALDRQSFIPRLTFLIYTNKNYTYKDYYLKKNRYFYLKSCLENKFKIERVIFQLQNNGRLGIVVHTKSLDFIESYSKEKNKDKFKQIILTRFNELFRGNSSINQLSGNESITVMKWRASQPTGIGIPLSLQLCKNYRVGFCGDWFEGEGFGRIEGSIMSALILAKKFRTHS